MSTSGLTQYCTNMTPSHPKYDGATTQILSVNMNWTTKIHRIHSTSACIQMAKKHALVYIFFNPNIENGSVNVYEMVN